MKLIRDAWKLVLEQKQTVAAYVAVVTLINFIHRYLAINLREMMENEPGLMVNLADIAIRIVISAIFAAVLSVFFSRLGKSIDRPFWKCKDDLESLKRFFLPWFILVLIFYMLVRMQLVAAQHDSGDAILMLEFILIVFFSFLIPLGACVMYWGRLNFDELPEALSPITKQFSLVAIVLLMSFSEFFVGMILYPSLIPENLQHNSFLYIPSDIALGIVDCLIFTTMWLVLMIHRDTDYSSNMDF